MNKKWDSDSNYILRFEKNYMGAIGNIFCQAVRSGCDDIDSIMDYVAKDCRERIRSPYATESRIRNYNSVIDSLGDDDAIEFAEHILWRENLPKEEHDRLKSESRTEGLNDFMATQNPTEKQLSYLKALGCSEVPTDKKRASDLIGEWKNKK